MDTDTLTILKTISSCAEVLSAIACLCLISYYFKQKIKPISFKMIVILSASDLLFHIAFVFYFWLNVQLMLLPVNLALQFSVFWSSNISFFVLKSLEMDDLSAPKKYFKKSFILLFLLSTAFSITGLYYVLQERKDIAAYFLMVPSLISILITTILYFRGIIVLRSYPIQFKDSIKFAIRTLSWYSIAQLLTVSPDLIYFTVASLQKTDYPKLKELVRIPLSLAGFANASIFLFQIKRSRANFKEDSFVDTNMELIRESQL